ncbi:hypothetical protein BC939DRAFT_453087 [Gamsiella multidivaricata]|uniref:uncharacterized protein n=1 Tax=Gamsiella multidivaricata TaxID=101098 RepID=UPI00221F26EF|nr:uncharacterized protein BC939DRAFT_453087 [Gamsiella multidivaricata]KAI7822948.1 hypothetical protein BC939DRAFT_453087 [Gamsiella multidivaricata]
MARFHLSPLNQRSYLAASSFDTRNLHNPFQDPSFSPEPEYGSSVPVASDTIASAPTSSTTRTANEYSQILSKDDRSDALKGDPRPTDSMSYHKDSNATNTTEPQNSIQEQDLEQEQDQDQDQDQDQENPLTYLTQTQRAAALENLEIEMMDRAQTLRASVAVLINSLRFRSEAELNRLPAAVRTMTVEEFWFSYEGSAKEYLERQATKKSAANTAFLHDIEVSKKLQCRCSTNECRSCHFLHSFHYIY